MLHRHPLLAAEWLQLRNRLVPISRPAIAAAVAGAVFFLALLRYAVDADAFLMLVAAQFPIVFALSSLVVMSNVTRRRRRLAAEDSRSWLAAAPIAQSDRRIAFAVRILLPICALISSASVLVLAAAKGQTARGAALLICSLLWVGLAVGSIAGWLAARRGAPSRYEASRYAPAITAAATLEPSNRALSHWPIAQAFAWGRPENLRVLIIVCLLLGVQAGTSALHGLLIVAAWLLAGYLSSLLASVPHAANAAGRWLRSTPIARAEFGWALTRWALLHQLVGAVIAAFAVGALGSPLRMTLVLCALWVGVIALTYAAGVVRAYR